MHKLILLICGTLWLMSGSAWAQQTKAKALYTPVSATKLTGFLRRKKPLIIDVRVDGERWNAGVKWGLKRCAGCPQPTMAPFDADMHFDPTDIKGFRCPANRPVLVVCRQSWRSPLAANWLIQNVKGCTPKNVFNLTGGLDLLANPRQRRLLYGEPPELLVVN